MFDWTLLQACKRPFFLAGGLGPQNIARAIRQVRPYGVDVSSGVETEGQKDAMKINQFLQIIANITNITKEVCI